jgi:hypothetical protein
MELVLLVIDIVNRRYKQELFRGSSQLSLAKLRVL